MTHRSKFKLRSPAKIAIGFVTIGALLYGGWNYGVGSWIMSQKFADIKPSKVTLLGLKYDRGLHVLVANRMAQLLEKKDGHGFEGSVGNDAQGSDAAMSDEASSKKRIPVADMLGALSGNEAALSRFVTTLNDLAPNNDWPTSRIVWQAADIQKALDGDKPTVEKLESAINMHLDGRPLPQLQMTALENGIIVDTPVTVQVRVGASVLPMIAHIQRPYRPKMLVDVTHDYATNANLNDNVRLGTYIEFGKKLNANPKLREDIRSSLKAMSDPAGLKEYVTRAEDILSSTRVVLTDRYIEDAAYTKDTVGGNTFYDMTIHVNEEGRRRLWQYSRAHPKDQLLLISDGVAIAAPQIRHELITKELTIVQLPDETLAKDAVDSINQAHLKV